MLFLMSACPGFLELVCTEDKQIQTSSFTAALLRNPFTLFLSSGTSLTFPSCKHSPVHADKVLLDRVD